MGVQRSLFAALKHVVPSDLEYYLDHISRVPKKFVFMVTSALIGVGVGSLTFRAEKQNKTGLINISHTVKMLT